MGPQRWLGQEWCKHDIPLINHGIGFTDVLLDIFFFHLDHILSSKSILNML